MAETPELMREGKPKILLVDDEESLRKLVRATLESSAYELLEAADGRQGLEIARRERPALVLLDIAMPGLDGLQVCQQLKGNPATRDTVVIMLTALGQEADRQRGFEAGADDYFTKPFSPIALLNKVNEVLSARQS